jgi:hypothetical protein
MQPIIIVIGNAPLLIYALLPYALLAVRAVLRRRPTIPYDHGLKELRDL